MEEEESQGDQRRLARLALFACNYNKAQELRRAQKEKKHNLIKMKSCTKQNCFALFIVRKMIATNCSSFFKYPVNR